MNNITLTGRVATIPENKSSQSGLSICTFRLAVSKVGKDEAMFVPIKAFGKTADTCSKYLVKGQEVAIAGELNIENYERNGQKLTWVEVNAGRVELGAKPKNADKNQKEEKAITDLFGHDFLTNDESLPF